MNTSPHPLRIAGLQTDGVHSSFPYSQAVQRGQLLRLRRGVYLPADIWLQSQPSQRYQLMIAATDLQLHGPVFCRESALQIHHLPLLDLPASVHLRASSPATVRTTQQPPLTGRVSPAEFWAQAQTLGTAAGPHFSAAMFRGFSTTRHTPTHNQEAAPQSRDLLLDASTAPHQPLSRLEVRTEPMDFALVDTVPRMTFDAAIVTLDAALRGVNRQPGADADHLQQMAEQVLDSQRKNGYFQNLLHFASPLSESPGESLARVRLHELGFEQPQQQVSMSIDGATYRVDFLWEEAGVVAEFDGWKKYHSVGFNDSLKQEKIREDAIRSTGRAVVRFYWEDLIQPGCHRLVQLLVRAGVPRFSSPRPLHRS